jgi:hypothetical protein
MAGSDNPFARTRTATVSTRVTDEEYKELEVLAQEQGLTMSEWARKVLLDQRDIEPVGQEVVLAEVMALRAIVLNVVTAQARGETLSQERIKELVRFADVERYRRAVERLIEAGNRGEIDRGKIQREKIKSNGKK